MVFGPVSPVQDPTAQRLTVPFLHKDTRRAYSSFQETRDEMLCPIRTQSSPAAAPSTETQRARSAGTTCVVVVGDTFRRLFPLPSSRAVDYWLTKHV